MLLTEAKLPWLMQHCCTIYSRGGQPFEVRVQQKEKSKLQGPHPGNTFITIKNTIYNMKSINVKLDAASAH